MNLGKFLLSALCGLLMATSNANAEEIITPLDLKRFGWEYVGKEVKMFAVLNDVYAARNPKNKGRVAPSVIYKGKIYGPGMFLKGIKSTVIAPSIGKCVWFSGKINTRDVNTDGNLSKLPTFDIEVMKVAEPHQCE